MAGEGMDYLDMRPSVPKDRFPRIILIIILAEFCERFSFSGMKAFLTLYLRSKLGYTDDGATEIYHLFSTFAYVFPIIGGVLADNYLGKFRTILYLMFVYAAGNILVAVTAIPQVPFSGRIFTMIGLLMITMGTGGIKPCVTAFGGDQFKIPEQEHHLSIFFSIMYFNLCFAGLISKALSPVLRSEVHCFGDKDCYSLAFGAPALVVLLSIVIFLSARKRYVLKKPEGNILLDFIKCISLGVKNVLQKKTEKGVHWLDSTQHCYDSKFIKDIKRTLSVLVLFTACPVFWALIDQMGSRWTLQATKMDGRFGYLTVKPDQMIVLNPIIILIVIPIAQKYVYPFLERRDILKNPLHKMTLGGILAGVAFIASGILEIYLRTKYPQLPQPGYSQIRIFNGNPCSVSLQNYHHNITYTIPPLSHFVKKDVKVTGTQNIMLDLGGSCIVPRKEMFLLEENSAVSFFIDGNDIHRYNDVLEKSKSGFPVVRFLVTQRVTGQNITFTRESNNEVEAYIHRGVSKTIEIFTDTYSIRLDTASTINVTINKGAIHQTKTANSTEIAILNNKIFSNIVARDLRMESGGVYTVILDRNDNGYEVNVVIITEANTISMVLLFPQFLIMSVAELLFGITGNEFVFKEAPESMKAVLTSAWLLTEAMGNVIIIVITRFLVGYGQHTQFFFYTVLMFISITIFYFLSRGYKFCHEEEHARKVRSPSEVLYLQVKQTEDCLDH
ncbi:peptide transporter family 1-like [Plodia interpunctella]|uniref:peptide transporter family 1-like n=1 Tax=Plodia interpunctella TaxID=58824 RepID=UPI002368A344|nr:peptide transporter family 1-like [Plodia interpunctella]